LYNILSAAKKIKVHGVRFGLRQQLLVDLESFSISDFTAELDKLAIPYQVDNNAYPNIVSSYPAANAFIRDSWLSEALYKEVLDSFKYEPAIKVNICDRDQSFTPMLTGNINWIAAASVINYWHLIIRFPKTNVIHEWNMLTQTNDISTVSQALEQIMTENASRFIDNPEADGEQLFATLKNEGYQLKTAGKKVVLPLFNLPYYEGLNRYDNKYWLGIYRRDEVFGVDFLQKLCKLCMDTWLDQLCCTSWKTIMVKGIEEQFRDAWNLLLEEFQINMRHAANELNFQVEDNSTEALALKNYLVKHLGMDDTRTFGICIGIKTRKKSEIFSSILVRRRYLIDFMGIRVGKVYDILCAKDFNPNERTEEIFSSGNPKIVLPEQLRRSVVKYYNYRAGLQKKMKTTEAKLKLAAEKK